MSNIILLGAGMVGSAMAIDLSKKHNITVADIDISALKRIQVEYQNIQIVQLDVTDKKGLREQIKPFDLVICAVPGFLGYETLKSIIETSKNVVDISFSPENILDLNPLALERGVTAIIDCGVAPGMGNFILGYHDSLMKVEKFECLVGGLPKVRKWPFCYKAPFSPIDVIEEYTRPARYVENGVIITKPAMSETEYVEFEKVGTLESFNTDGLRSILFTMKHIPDMKEKTLRFPGHIEYIKVLKESGFFSTDKVKGTELTPLEFSSRILFNEWKLGENEDEFTVMRVTLEGKEENMPKKIIYELYDEYDEDTQISSMARTTGYTATAAANMVLDGLFQEKGVFPPELIGKHRECFEYIIRYLKERKVIYYRKEDNVLENVF